MTALLSREASRIPRASAKLIYFAVEKREGVQQSIWKLLYFGDYRFSSPSFFFFGCANAQFQEGSSFQKANSVGELRQRGFTGSSPTFLAAMTRRGFSTCVGALCVCLLRTSRPYFSSPSARVFACGGETECARRRSSLHTDVFVSIYSLS